jgi:hypothetical protein
MVPRNDSEPLRRYPENGWTPGEPGPGAMGGGISIKKGEAT